MSGSFIFIILKRIPLCQTSSKALEMSKKNVHNNLLVPTFCLKLFFGDSVVGSIDYGFADEVVQFGDVKWSLVYVDV